MNRDTVSLINQVKPKWGTVCPVIKERLLEAGDPAMSTNPPPPHMPTQGTVRAHPNHTSYTEDNQTIIVTSLVRGHQQTKQARTGLHSPVMECGYHTTLVLAALSCSPHLCHTADLRTALSTSSQCRPAKK